MLGVGVLVAGGDPSVADPHGANCIANPRQFYEAADTGCVTRSTWANVKIRCLYVNDRYKMREGGASCGWPG